MKIQIEKISEICRDAESELDSKTGFNSIASFESTIGIDNNALILNGRYGKFAVQRMLNLRLLKSAYLPYECISDCAYTMVEQLYVYVMEENK